MSITTVNMAVRRAPSHEAILRQFRSSRGLYILGAGASAGLVPFGSSFLSIPAIDYVLGGSFPGDIPRQSELTRRSRDALLNMNPDDRMAQLFPGREVRPGTMDFPYEDIVSRLPDFSTWLQLNHLLAQPRYQQRQSDSYLVFRLFRQSVILNYNLDGLASDICGAFHDVIAVHGTAEHGYGSPGMAEYLKVAREFDLPVPRDDRVLCIPESRGDIQLQRKLLEAMGLRPRFVAVIGYSFGHDDRISWETFSHTFHRFGGNVYVIDPKPDELADRIAVAIKSDRVFGIRAHWNVLAHAFVNALSSSPDRRSLNYVCQHILDSVGGGIAFPH